VLNAIPLYYLFFLKPHPTFAKKDYKTTTQLSLGWGTEGRKIVQIKWEYICKSKLKGGLGIKEIDGFNKALLGIWKCWLGSTETGLWNDIITSKYGT